MKLTPIDKAQAINNDFGEVLETGEVLKLGPVNYRGAIAEIGAGQEVARLFFEALGSSRTIVKTMSAYGMGCSDAIYTPAISRVTGLRCSYISEERIAQMFDHDYPLLLKRSLAEKEKPVEQILRYFAFADTVDIKRDGWAAVRLQINGCSLNPTSHDAIEYIVHYEILAADKAAKIKIVGALGVNLIHGAILNGEQGKLSDAAFVSALMDTIEKSDLRIDKIEVRKLRIHVEKSSSDDLSVIPEQIEEESFGVKSMNMCIELVKTSTVRCAAFKNTRRPAHTSYDSIPDNNHLILTRSACDVDGLPLEMEMLNCAKKALKRALSLSESNITTAIHIPILSILPASMLADLYEYIDRNLEQDNGPKIKAADLRSQLIKSVDADDIALRIDRIVRENNVAFLSEFSASSEMMKFIRTKTRLKKSELPPLGDEVAFVLRADQMVMFLINVKERFKDRRPVEIVGSIIRRNTKIFIYPCTYAQIFQSKTLYGTPVIDAFNKSKLDGRWVDNMQRVTKVNLECDLSDTYLPILSYLESERAIYDLQPDTDRFLDYPLRPHDYY